MVKLVRHGAQISPHSPRHSIRALSGAELAGDFQLFQVKDDDFVVRGCSYEGTGPVGDNQDALRCLSDSQALHELAACGVENHYVAAAEIRDQHQLAVRSEL